MFTILATLLIYTGYSQVNITGKGGYYNKGEVLLTVDVGYKFDTKKAKDLTIHLGQIATVTNYVDNPEVYYLAMGKDFGEDVILNFSGGFAVQRYMREVWKGTQAIYSHWEKAYLGRYYLSASIKKEAFKQSFLGGEVFATGKVVGIQLFLTYSFKP